MENTITQKRIHESIAWGAIFVWWGITELFRLPNGMDALGIGLILLGVTAARSHMGFATNGLTITLGILAVVWGMLDLSRSVLGLPLAAGNEFAILLIALGAILLASALLRVRQTGLNDQKPGEEFAR